MDSISQILQEHAAFSMSRGIWKEPQRVGAERQSSVFSFRCLIRTQREYVKDKQQMRRPGELVCVLRINPIAVRQETILFCPSFLIQIKSIYTLN